MSQSVYRAAQILNALAEQPATVSQLAQQFSLHRTTMFRELQTLENVGFVRRQANGTYVLAFQLIALAQYALESLDLRQVAGSHLRELHDTVGNTVHLAALVEGGIYYVDKVEDRGGVHMYSRVGSRVLPQCTGVGKAILAELDAAGRDTVLADTKWKHYTPRTVTSRRALDAELERVATQGYAIDNSEFEELVHCVAVPIRSVAGVIGALSLTAFRALVPLSELELRIPLLQRVARRLSREIS